MNIFLHLAKGFEEIEAITTVDVLRRAGLNVKLVSIMDKKEVTGAWGTTIAADLLFDEVDYESGNMIILPGGMEGTENLSEHVGLANEIRSYYNNGKWLCAICAAPMVLGKVGVLRGKVATCYPGCEDALDGAKVNEERVVVDGKIITGKGPGASFDFALKIVELLKGIDTVKKLKGEMFIR